MLIDFLPISYRGPPANLNVMLKDYRERFRSTIFCRVVFFFFFLFDERVQMRDCCHGISNADLVYNRFSDDCLLLSCHLFCQPRAASLYARIHGSFTRSQHFKNKRSPPPFKDFQNRAPAERTACLYGTSCSHAQHNETKGSSGCLSIPGPRCHPVAAPPRVTVMKCLRRAVSAAQ